MGGSQSREDIDLSDSEYEDESDSEEQYDDEDYTLNSKTTPTNPKPTPSNASVSALDDIDSRLKSLKLKYNKAEAVKLNSKNGVKLYLHIGGNTPKSKWIVSEKLCYYKFVKLLNIDNEGEDDDEEEGEGEREGGVWVLKVGGKIRVRVSSEMQMKMFGDQRRVDLVDKGVWAMRFYSDEEYREFVLRFQDCLFENVYGLEASEENKLKVYGKDFIGWVKPEEGDDAMWEDADEGVWGKEGKKGAESSRERESQDLLEEFEEEA